MQNENSKFKIEKCKKCGMGFKIKLQNSK